ncbi:30S ribosomal protein S18 [Candidatus Hepatincolaceae symbiont of Richtersius coronifer]
MNNSNNPTINVNDDKSANEDSGKKTKETSVFSEIDYKNVEFLQRYTSERGKILPRRLTLATAKEQRELAQAIKRARFLALMAPVAQ